MNLTKKSDNAAITATFNEMGVKVNTCARVICINPTDKDPENKSTVFVIAEVPGLSTDSKDYSRMSLAERLSHGFSTETLLRGRITMVNDIIEKLAIKPGDEVKINNEKFVLRVYEAFNPFFAGQNPVQRRVNGKLEPRLKNGKKFYRDTKVVLESELLRDGHQLITENSVANLVE